MASIDNENYSISDSEFGHEEYQDMENFSDWNDSENEYSKDMKCLFCTEQYDSSSDLFLHCRQTHKFDFIELKLKLKLDFYHSVRLLNYIRKKVDENDLDSIFKVKFTGKEPLFTDDELLVPYLSEDPLLYAFEDIFEGAISQFSAQSGYSERLSTIEGETLIYQFRQNKKKLKNTEAQLIALKDQFEQYKLMVKQSFYDPLLNDGQGGADDDVKSIQRQVKDMRMEGDYYFESYAGVDIHEQMIKDSIRTDGYRDFILKNSEYFKDKIVLDVGCGTGILSMFAAQAGAKHVYSVDNSDIIEKAKLNIKENNFEDKITLVRGKIEEIQLPVPQVDIIISEWMGYFLLFESMLDSVLVAKKKYLKPDGLLAPNYCQMMLAGFMDDQLMKGKFGFWDDVYGFKMTSMKSMSYDEAYIDVLDKSTVITNLFSIKDLDLMNIDVSELEFTSEFQLLITKSGALHGLFGYFDTLFTTNKEEELDWILASDTGIAPIDPETGAVNYETVNEMVIEGQDQPIAFSTGPFSKATHWKQTLFIFKESLSVEQGDFLRGSLECKKHALNPRELVITIKADLVHSTSQQVKSTVEQKFLLA
ncbi:S-adenosyl-L-methionine-dependent methyltransferase [Conidiobolus coronatus NRRL 28638]|uniref:type I protein arginine methyltransferase n=1 Tax=Conidiobolus coronatus (strain ATCC 28846 / CBS 209.66 / NRRL 28638) TaxID=796925 RepID=A0A137P6I6_CONC2|nr:S-adenosyl-L-methionine-dependent methyltransferase [Conidiobolus coronatus NRRL 28638]|eukprot:KXN70544.1 S-adenosyl-L-methionine-dependent methyltransferase [Conidiobolus coronatus NRRL 28638]